MIHGRDPSRGLRGFRNCDPGPVESDRPLQIATKPAADVSVLIGLILRRLTD
jgi:hypothetical protein